MYPEKGKERVGFSFSSVPKLSPLSDVQNMRSYQKEITRKLGKKRF